MPKTLTKSPAQERFRSVLEALPGVEHVVWDPSSDRVHLVCRQPDPQLPVEAAAHAALARAGIPPESVSLLVRYVSSAGAQRRVRFVDAALDRPRVGLAIARVELEWAGRRFDGTAEGEGGSPCELRVSAQATLRALEAVLDGQVSFELVGIKAIRIFDQDLVSVILRSPDVPDRRLVGVSLVLIDPYRSAALAVLNATNRLLGNYLAAE
jgi:hypothetical protein